jgi:hypothetical protein
MHYTCLTWESAADVHPLQLKRTQKQVPHKKSPWPLVRKETIQTERPPLVYEI